MAGSPTSPSSTGSNAVVTNLTHAHKEKKKKKRLLEQSADVSLAGNPMKKKKKKQMVEEGGAVGMVGEGVFSIPMQTLERDQNIVGELGEKKKKKKKDKGKRRAEEPASMNPVPEAIHPQPSADEDIARASADFLSAVVAAASATADAQQAPDFQQPMPGFHPPPFSEHLMPFPTPGFPYSSPHASFPHMMPPPPGHMFAELQGHPLPDLSMASSEDLLRTLQDLDISKIASMLKTLGEAGTVSGSVPLHIPPSYMSQPSIQPPGPPPVKQAPVKSNMILNRPPKTSKQASQGSKAIPTLVPVPHVAAPSDEGNPDHAHMLANVWMNPNRLAEMVKTHGLVYKKGKFSAIEEAQLRSAIENYRVSHGLEEEDLVRVIFNDKDREGFWPEITASVPLRPIIAVYHHVRRVFHPMRLQGKWLPEEDQLLEDAVRQYGQRWEKVSAAVKRPAGDCRDRYRNHIQDRHGRRTGTWTKEEENELTKIVLEMTVEQGKDIDNDIFWGVVSQRMGNKRGRQQCRIKWTDSLSTQIKNAGQRPRWSQLDAYILVHKIDSLNVRDDSEVDWKKIPDEDWNVWSAHALQRRWTTMKRSVKGWEAMSHAEIMDILRTKKAQSPPPAPPARKEVRSAESVADSDDLDDFSGATQANVGPSQVPGGLFGHVGQ